MKTRIILSGNDNSCYDNIRKRRRRILFDDQIVSDEIGNHKYELPAKS